MTFSPLIVAALDFGTTYSGYAFQMRHDHDRDPLKVSTNNWIGSGNLMSQKTPSTILLTPDKKFHSFGYEAETKYSELTEENQHEGWLYFKQFKMVLHNNKTLKRSTLIKDIKGQMMPAKTIFCMAIRFLREHLLGIIHQQILDGVDEDMIGWVITVPAIWDDGAKQFMREAAEAAGINKRRLQLALEPEAASIYCMKEQSLAAQTAASAAVFEEGTKFIVLDCGGGTIDMTVHQLTAGMKIREIRRASGGAFGGTTVDESFCKFLVDVFGNEVIEELKQQSMTDYLELLRDFEAKKRGIKLEGSRKLVMHVPVTLTDLFKSMTGSNAAETMAKSKYCNIAQLKRDKIHITRDLYKEFFSNATEGTMNHLLEVITDDITVIVLVGGFSESPMIQSIFQEMFPNKIVLCPANPGLAVLKGAVLYGFEPHVIQSRAMKFTYGVEVNNVFNPEVHHPANKFWSYGSKNWYCSKCFDPFVTAGQELEVGSVLTKIYNPDQKPTDVEITIYASNQIPTYINEPSCYKLGTIVVQRPAGGWPPHSQLRVDMMFGGTEFTVEVSDTHQCTTYTNSFDFL